MVIDLPSARSDGDAVSGHETSQRLSYGVQARLTAAQHRGVQLLSEQRGEPVSSIVRDAVAAYLDSFSDKDGVTLLDELEAEVASDRVSAKRLAAMARTQRAASQR